MVFPEGKRNDRSTISRFHKGAFLFAERYGLDIQPFIIHGLNVVLPRNSFQVFTGSIMVKGYERVRQDGHTTYSEMTSRVHAFYKKEYERLACEIETAAYFAPLVEDRYCYKGVEIYRSVHKNIKRNNCFTRWIDTSESLSAVLIKNNDNGEFALLYALVHPSTLVTVLEEDESKRALLTYCAKGVADNLQVMDHVDMKEAEEAGIKIISL